MSEVECGEGDGTLGGDFGELIRGLIIGLREEEIFEGEFVVKNEAVLIPESEEVRI